MDTSTGEIFPLAEIDRLRARRDAEQDLDAKQRELLERYERGVAAGHVVPVSDGVARQQLLGQRVEGAVRDLEQLRDPESPS